jgi:hypothetical protein
MEWFDCFIPLCPPGGLDSKEFDAMDNMFHIQVKDEILGEDWLECFATEILDAKYEKTDVAEVVKGLTHLNAHQNADFLWVLQENNKMFNGTLGVYPHKRVHIDIDPNAKPVHSRPYSLPWIHSKTFKKKLDHLVKIGVLAAQQESEWVLPSFIFPKKDGRVCWISDLRQLNIFVLDEFIEQKNSYIWICTCEFIYWMNSYEIHIGFWFLPWACQLSFLGELVANMPPPTAHRPDRIITHYNHNNDFDTLNSSTSIEF